MTVFLRTCAVFLLVPLLFACSSQPVREDDRTINELLDVLKMDVVLEGFPELIATSMGQLEQMEPKNREELQTALQEAFHPKRLKNGIIRSLRKTYDADRYQSVLAAMRSDIHQRMISVEMQTTTPDFFEGLAEFAKELENKPASQDRITLMGDLDRASNAIEASVIIQMGLVKGMLRGAMMLDPPALRESTEQLENTFNQIEAQIRQSAANESLITNLYIYRSVKAEDIRAYIQMYKQPHVTWFMDHFVMAFADALEESGQTMVEKLET